jgi:hypothetical protein
MLNRAVARMPLFEKLEDYEAFERVLIETHAHFLCHFCATVKNLLAAPSWFRICLRVA